MTCSSAYRAVWTWCWFLVLGSGVAWAALVLPLATVVGAWLIGVTAVAGTGLATLDGGSLTHAVGAWLEPAAWGGLTGVAAAVASVQWPGAAVPLVAAVVGTSPGASGWLRRQLPGATTPAEPGRGNLLSCLTLEELDGLWRTSDVRLCRSRSSEETLAIVQRRERLLDELDRRIDARRRAGY